MHCFLQNGNEERNKGINYGEEAKKNLNIYSSILELGLVFEFVTIDTLE